MRRLDSITNSVNTNLSRPGVLHAVHGVADSDMSQRLDNNKIKAYSLKKLREKEAKSALREHITNTDTIITFLIETEV